MLSIHCPYCGESYASVVDVSAGSQRYIEDCAVCCRPIEISLHVGDDGELLGIDTATEND
jgi:transcription elongation factor Elf1